MRRHSSKCAISSKCARVSCIRQALLRALRCTSLCNSTLPKSASRRFVTVFGADSLSETVRCIATRQNKMAAPDVVSARLKKLSVFVFVLGRSALCINDHRTQNKSLKQAPLAFYEKFPVLKIASFWQTF